MPPPTAAVTAATLGALAVLAFASACRHAPSLRPGDDISDVAAGTVLEIDFDAPGGRIAAKRVAPGSARFDVTMAQPGHAPARRCAPAMPFDAAFAGAFTLRVGPRAAPGDAARAREAGGAPSILRIRSSAIPDEPSEARVVLDERGPPRLLLLWDDGVYPLELSPEVVLRLAKGCPAFP
jgi:hypothetical protein